MMFQYTGRFEACSRLVFLLFDQFQRHTATRVLSSRVKCNPESFKIFEDWVKEPNFINELKVAYHNPTTQASKNLLKKLTKHIRSCTTRIPFTSAYRSASMSNLISLKCMHGMPTIFFTHALDYEHETLMLRLSLPQTNNKDFPSQDLGFAESIRRKETKFHSINITPHHLKTILANGPVAAAEIFRLLTENVFAVLLGTPTEHSTKRTQPLPDRKPGVFGVPIASFGCVEEQARGSLHMHVLFWGGLPAHLLQCSGSYEQLTASIIQALNNMVKAEIDAEVHMNHLLLKCEGISPPRPALTNAHHPLRQAEEFHEDVQQAVVICNSHSHLQTCRASKQGKKGCRKRRPQPIVPVTSCCQIVPSIDNGIQTYKLLPEIAIPNIESQITRNVSRLPISEPDNRIIMWEIQRREISSFIFAD